MTEHDVYAWRSIKKMEGRTGLEELDRLMTGITAIEGLESSEQSAMLAWPRAVRWRPLYSHSGKVPCLGRAECELSGDWRAFYEVKAVQLGFFTFKDLGPWNHKLPGARQDLQWRAYEIEMTPFGYSVIEAYDAMWDIIQKARPPWNKDRDKQLKAWEN